MAKSSHKPDTFIVGAPKCGTTAMYEYLRQHPEIYMSRRKELNFFCRDLRPESYRGDLVDPQAYLTNFSECSVEKRVGEASVWYLYSRTAARDIKAFSPDANVIIMLRNPVDMVYSLYSHYIWLRHPTPLGVTDVRSQRVLSFEQALASQDERRRSFLDSFPWDQVALAGRRLGNVFHTDVAMYTDQVKRYIDRFGASRVLIIIFDDFKSDTADVYRRTLQFLSVDPAYHADLRVINSNKRIWNAKLHKLVNERDSKVKKLARLVVPDRLRMRMRRFVRSMNEQDKPRPSMNPQTRQSLEARFRPDVEKLSRLIDRDLISLWYGVP
ncbi:MAG: sulfotransferase domain-containing protein [Gammaproteobacteria bacterium]|nr:sulfotransferase domain-containing protein [Gammaproteobacteria bacterium]